MCKKNELRRVTYSVMNPALRGFDPDEIDNEEVNDLCKVKEGRFHTWAPSKKHDPQEDKLVSCMVAIIEDEETGEVMEIDPVNIRFVD